MMIKEKVRAILDELPEGEGNASEYFVGCIRRGEDPVGLTNPDLSRGAQEILEAGLLSATAGVAVSLPVEDHLFRG